MLTDQQQAFVNQLQALAAQYNYRIEHSWDGMDMVDNATGVTFAKAVSILC